jgi:hypothetical protein
VSLQTTKEKEYIINDIPKYPSSNPLFLSPFVSSSHQPQNNNKTKQNKKLEKEANTASGHEGFLH